MSVKEATEKIIMSAAQRIFIKKGFGAARMQEIAEEAGINKALLHYYFRTKEKLFEAIFEKVMGGIIQNLGDFLNANTSFETKIEQIAELYIDFLKKNPHIPIFVLQELQTNPQRLTNMLEKKNVKPMDVAKKLSEEISGGALTIHEIQDIIINFISMCIFPIAAKPVVTGFMFGGDSGKYDEFLENRKKTIPIFIKGAIAAALASKQEKSE